MLRRIFSLLILLAVAFCAMAHTSRIAPKASAAAQTLRLVPEVSAAAGTYDDEVTLTIVAPEGCAGAKWWTDGAELRGQRYDGPLTLTRSCDFSVAGVDAQGRIITDVVTRHYDIRRVTPPTVITTPKEGVRKESFYVTRIAWKYVTTATADLAPFKTGGARHGENVVWLTGPDGQTISAGDANNLWADGENAFKAYIYRNYTQTKVGDYVLHIAKGVFVLDGEVYDKELQLHYEIADGGGAPTFTPAEGEYKGSVEVTIEYPEDGSAFYKFYKLNGGKAKSYTAPLTLTETTTIEAYGMDEGFSTTTPSSKATYTLLPADPEPEVLPVPVMTLAENGRVSISGPEGATLKYWTDDRMATARLYEAPFLPEHNGPVACVAYTDRAVSPVATLNVTGIADPSEDPDRGNQVLLTPAALETAHLRALSPNGRWAVGYMGEDTSSRGFVWDVEADDIQYAPTMFVNQLWDVRDDGTAYGWRTPTQEVDESMTEADLLWGTYLDGEWTETTKDQFRTYPAVPEGYPEVSALSANGEWAILGQTHRLHVTTGEVEYLPSMSERFVGSSRPEVLTSIADDGTIFGTYDDTYFQPEKGIALVRTNDGRWRDVRDWLREERGVTCLDGYNLYSVRAVNGEASVLLFHAAARDYSEYDSFTRGLLLRIDVPVSHLAPVKVKAEQMSGVEVVRVTWKAPVTDAEKVTGYVVSRNGEKVAETAADVLVCYDTEVRTGEVTRYTVQALYADGRASQPSREATVTCQLFSHLPVRNLTTRRVGYADLALAWDAPIITLPKLQYFNEEKETFAFGTGSYDAEFGIRIPAADLKAYEGQQIVAFQFLPTGPQSGYTIHLYHGATGSDIDYDDTPFYSQTIDPATIHYGTINAVELDTAQPLDFDHDLYVALSIKSAGNNNMLGISYEGFRSGYTDLCRIVGIHDQMVAMSQNSQELTEVVLPLGVCISTPQSYDGSIVDHYEVAVADDRLSLDTPSVVLEDLPEGKQTIAVTAVYRDGVASQPLSTTVDMVYDDALLPSVEAQVTVDDDACAHITWETPLDYDRNVIHWGDMTPSRGWELPQGLGGFMATSLYPVTLTAPYADDYAISELYFCPTSEEAEYEVALADEEGTILAYFDVEQPVIGEINHLRIEQPVTIHPSITYRVVVNVVAHDQGIVALAYDSSGKWQNGYSNVVNYGEGDVTLADFVQYDEHPNWLMGMTVEKCDPRPLPVEGYTVRIDDATASAPATATTFSTERLAAGTHTAAVDVNYAAGKLRAGTPVTFTVGADGIRALEVDEDGNEGGGRKPHDLLGRRIIHDKAGHGLYIINTKKLIR